MGPVIVYQSGGMQQTLATHREFVLFYARSVPSKLLLSVCVYIDNERNSTTESDSAFFGKSVQRFLPQHYKPNPGPSVHPTSTANESIWNPIDNDEPNSALPTSLAHAPTHLNGYL